MCRGLLKPPLSPRLRDTCPYVQTQPCYDSFHFVVPSIPLSPRYTGPLSFVKPHLGDTPARPTKLTPVCNLHDWKSTPNSSSYPLNTSCQDGSNPEDLSKKAQGKKRPTWVSHTGSAYPPSYPYLTSKQKEPPPPPPAKRSLPKFGSGATPLYAKTSHRQ